MNAHIEKLKARFIEDGFRINDPENTDNFPFLYSTSKVRFDIVGLPIFLEEFFIFKEIDKVRNSNLSAFVDSAWNWALANENNMPNSAELSKKALEFAMKKFKGGGRFVASQMQDNSVRETICLIYVYAIAVSKSVEPDTLKWIHGKKSAVAKKSEKYGGFIVPVIYDTTLRKFHHFEKKPILGSAYYSEAQKVMKKRIY